MRIDADLNALIADRLSVLLTKIRIGTDRRFDYVNGAFPKEEEEEVA